MEYWKDQPQPQPPTLLPIPLYGVLADRTDSIRNVCLNHFGSLGAFHSILYWAETSYTPTLISNPNQSNGERESSPIE